MSFPSLAGKTVAVTGATGGIGFAMASRFAQEGASVILGGRNESKLKDALHKIQAVKPWPKLGTPPQHHALHIDVRQLSGWNNLVDRHVCALGSPTVSISAAGLVRCMLC